MQTKERKEAEERRRRQILKVIREICATTKSGEAPYKALCQMILDLGIMPKSNPHDLQRVQIWEVINEMVLEGVIKRRRDENLQAHLTLA